MSIDLLRTQVRDLLEAWLDDEQVERDGLLRLLAAHLSPSQMVDSQQSVKAKITAGPAPWDDAIAHLLADIASGTRTIERGLDIACGFTPRIRGGSDGNTRFALTRIPDLVDLLDGKHPDGAMRDLIGEAGVTIGSWHRAALTLLGAERRWAYVRTDHEDVNITIRNGELYHDPYPAIAVCPYCSSAVRIQPDVADDGDDERWSCDECTARQPCLTCTRRDQDAAVSSLLSRTLHIRPVWVDEIDEVRAAVPIVYGCKHVTVHGCDHAKRHYRQEEKGVAVCVNAQCYDETDGYPIRRTWPVDKFLGQLLTWRLDTTRARSA